MSGVLDAAAKPLETDLANGVKSENLAARNAYIRQASASADFNRFPTVYGEPEVCDEFVRKPLDTDFTKCALNPQFKASADRGSDSYQAMAIATLQDYVATLSAVAKSEAPGEIAENFESFLTSINDLAVEAKSSGSGEVIKASHIAPLTGLGKTLTDAYRYRILRRLITDAHEPVRLILADLIAASGETDKLIDLNDDLAQAYKDLEAAQDSKNAARYEKEASNWERKLTAYKKEVKNSQTARWVAVWNAQKALNILVKKPGEPEELVGVLENLKQLTQ